MANEATAALSDAYGHVMHGDDAGSSARIVWVVHPTRVAVDMSSGDKTMDNPLAVGEQSESSPARGFGYTQKFGEFTCYCLALCFSSFRVMASSWSHTII